MNQYSVSIQEAVIRGQREVNRPFKVIVTIALLLSVFFLSQGSLAALLLVPLGLIVAYSYNSYAIDKWRIWAYGSVADINQLQRSAELADVVPVRSWDRVGFFTTGPNRDALIDLQARFS